jgi:CRP/FNR family cyclic AMP-dependent transcriptional regulator
MATVSLKLLKSHALFGGIADADLREIRSLLQEKRFEKGKNIICEGEPGTCLYFIAQGSVEVLKKTSAAKRAEAKRIAVLRKGDTFGEMELIDTQASVATVRAIQNTVTLTLSSKDLYQIAKWNLKAFTLILMNLAREISRRLRRMDALVASSFFSRGEKKK